MIDELSNLDMIRAGFNMICAGLGLNPETDPHLRDTPMRAARAWREELCRGLLEPPPRVALFDTEDTDNMVVLRGIPVRSICAHHFLPFVGQAVVGYIPGRGQLLGLSKLSRIVDYWSRRPQVQERLTKEIADAFERYVIDNDNGGVGVLIEASHMCMSHRGVEHEGKMITSELRGLFRRDAAVRAEFMELANGRG